MATRWHCAALADEVPVLVRTLEGRSLALHIDLRDTVDTLKARIAALAAPGPGPEQFGLLHRGRPLSGTWRGCSTTLGQHGIVRDETLRMTSGLRGGGGGASRHYAVKPKPRGPTGMQRCFECKVELPPDAVFCHRCGVRLPWGSGASPGAGQGSPVFSAEEMRNGIPLSLAGVWEYANGTLHVAEGVDGGPLFYNGIELMPQDGWAVADFPVHGMAYRFRMGRAGCAAVLQQRSSSSTVWEPPTHLARQGSIGHNAVLITTCQARIFGFGVVPTNTVLVASGPPIKHKVGVTVVPLHPKGSVQRNHVRLRVPLDFSAEDDAVTGASCSVRYTSLNPLCQALKSLDTVLLRGSYVARLGAQGLVLPRRQDLPQEAIWDPTELRRWLEERGVIIVAVSYCWRTQGHPDPDGEQIALLGRVIMQRMAEQTLPLVDLALFIDWASLHQDPRDPEQEAAFDRALNDVDLWYAHKDTMVWSLTKVPEKLVQYQDRGWPLYEKTITGLLTEGAKLVDFGKMNDTCNDWFTTCSVCTTDPHPLLSPASFEALLAKKTFSNRADHIRVSAMYESTFTEVMESTTTLEYIDLGWDTKQVNHILEVLPFCCGRLSKFLLNGNQLGIEGAVALAKRLPQLTSLRELRLKTCCLGDSGAEALAPGLAACPNLAVLDLCANDIGPKGAAAIAASIPVCQELTTLWLNSNEMGAEGAKAFVAAVGQCGPLRTLYLQRTGIQAGVGVGEKLMKAWCKTGKEARFLHLD